MKSLKLICVFVFFTNKCAPAEGIFLIVPEDVANGLAAVYGFAPRIVTGRDHRVGFGFRFGNHADLQLMYEIGPQLHTRPLPKIQTRSARQRQRIVRRPFIELLFRAGILREETSTIVSSSSDS